MLLAKNKINDVSSRDQEGPSTSSLVAPAADKSQGPLFNADDVQRLMGEYRQGGLSYHEIRRKENLRAIRQRWPLLAELDDMT